MRIAFDLDGTLIIEDHPFPLEKRAKPYEHKPLSSEQLRAGLINLYQNIVNLDHEFWVYTSSYRSIEAIERLFKQYELNLHGIINQGIHHNTLAKKENELRWISKYPPAFEIDLLIDNSTLVQEESKKWGFEVLLISATDLFWTEKIMQKISLLQNDIL
ncbi:MAG: hypothetical protein ACPGJS_10160 [Flammeovirgaceae bacterium]